MNRNRLMVGLAVAVLLAFVLSAYVYHAFKKAEVNAAGPSLRMTTIVVASEPIKVGTRLDASKVKVIQWPSNTRPEGMFSDITEVANRAAVNNIAENEPILAANLASTESGAGLSATIPEGMRAVSVSVNDVVGVAGFVTPGTMVDVLVTGNSMGNGGGSVTRTILENIKVLAAGQKMEQDREGKPENVPVITLLVTPEDAGKLTMAATEGKIQLALRNTVDTKNTSPSPVLQSNLFSGGAPAAPVAAPSSGKRAAAVAKPVAPPPYAVEVITGTKQETKNFPNP